MHELAHVFGVPNPDRVDVETQFGLHCSNTCIMRYAARTPDDWECYTWDRFRRGPFCESCVRDLRAYFAEGDESKSEEDSAAATGA
jgi:predicted Zn-dependent protease